MNRRLSSVAMAIFAAIAVFATPIFLTGCGATPETRQAATYQTLKSTQIAVDSAMKVYGAAVHSGKVSVEKQAQIDQAHVQYRGAFRAAVQAARGDVLAGPPAGLMQLADQLQLLITKL